MLRALVGAYNVVVDVREHLPPPGRYDAAFGRRPPAELRVATAADGGARATPVGDDEVRADEELDVVWAAAVSNARQGAEPSADVDVEADAELSELGVRVDRADVAERDVIRVAKQSQVPRAKARKYERTVSVVVAIRRALRRSRCFKPGSRRRNVEERRRAAARSRRRRGKRRNRSGTMRQSTPQTRSSGCVK